VQEVFLMAHLYPVAAPRGRLPRGPADQRPDREPPRLFTRLHMPAIGPLVSRFRVLADLVGGDRALVCVGPSRAEALARARRIGQRGELPAATVDLVLQCWTGGLSGGWRDMKSLSLRERAR
jgi:hypothetical protein